MDMPNEIYMRYDGDDGLEMTAEYDPCGFRYVFDGGWIHVSDELPVQRYRNKAVPVIVLLNERTVNTEACFDEGQFYLHGQVIYNVTRWMLPPSPPAK